MDSVLLTPRLQLTLITSHERGSDELQWLHELRSNKEAMHWSIYPPSQTIEDTEKTIKRYLSNPADPATKYNISYAVRDMSSPTPSFIGQVHLATVSGTSLPLPPHLTITAEQEQTTLVVELAYSFLPKAWGKGYATEAVGTVLSACKREERRGFWSPWEKVWVRVIVNGRNEPSRKVLQKCGVEERGIYRWKGERIFVGGEWMTEEDLHIFGQYLKE